jgi:hypothetical protein
LGVRVRPAAPLPSRRRPPGTTPGRRPQRAARSTFAIPQLAVQTGIDAGVFHEREGYGRDEMAFNLWALVHGLAQLRTTRLRFMEADYERLYRSLLGALVEQFEGPPGA